MLTLISFFNITHANAFRADTVAVSLGRGHALVRVHAEGFVTIAECKLDRESTRDLWFRTPESLRSCDVGQVRMPDFPGNLARFDAEVAEQLRHSLDSDQAVVRWSQRRGTAVAAGVIAALVYHPLGRLVVDGTRASRVLHGAMITGTGLFATGAWHAGSRRHLRKDAAFREVARALVAAAPGTNPAPPLLVINSGYAFEHIRDVMREALARVDVSSPRP